MPVGVGVPARLVVTSSSVGGLRRPPPDRRDTEQVVYRLAEERVVSAIAMWSTRPDG
ncbi:MAG TPA: hypothetical protein VJT31_30785 [Rugosimonospora sp.]|nr:hypothetical protein [Rugosimonospora sp.]